MPKTCPDCAGKGYLEEDGDEKNCGTCRGSGKIDLAPDDCAPCNGGGKRSGGKCRACGGSGKRAR